MDRPDQPHRARLVASAATLVIVAAALAWVGTSICQYRFGVEDQAQYLVQLRSIESPDAHTGDPYLDSFSALGSVLWHGIAAIATPGALPTLVLGLHLAITGLFALALAWAVWPAVPRPGGPGTAHAIAAALLAMVPALLLVVPKEQNWFGLVSLSDRELTASSAVLPLVALCIGLVIRHRLGLALAAAALAVPIQGQTGAYLLTAWGVLALWTTRHDRRGLIGVVCIGLIGMVGLLVQRAHSAVPADLLDAYESIGMGLFPELIDPRTAPIRSWASVLALLGLGAVAARRLGIVRGRQPIEPADRTAVRRLGLWTVASLAFPAVGMALLTVGMREPVLWKLMVGRSLMLAQLGSILLISIWIARQLAHSRLAWVAAVSVLVLMTVWPVDGRGVIVAGVGVGFLGALIALVPAHRCRAPVDRGRPDSAAAACDSTTSRGPCPRGCPMRAGAGVLIALVVAAAMGVGAFVDRPYPWLASGEDADWLEAQHWARDHTPTDAIFLTPPYRSGWRVGSERSTFGEIKDGCLLFYAGDAALDWAQRMRSLGFSQLDPFIEVYGSAGGGGHDHPRPTLDQMRERYHAALTRGRLAEAREHGATYLITEREGDPVLGDPVWSNQSYIIRRLVLPLDPQ